MCETIMRPLHEGQGPERLAVEIGAAIPRGLRLGDVAAAATRHWGGCQQTSLQFSFLRLVRSYLGSWTGATATSVEQGPGGSGGL